MTIIDDALDLVPDHACIGLGSGQAARAFVTALGERVRAGRLSVRGVATSSDTEHLARQVGIPLITLREAGNLQLTVDGADEVDPELNLIKGYGRAMVRERIVAYTSHRLVILVGEEKLVPQLGTRGRLPIEVTPFALPICQRVLLNRGFGLPEFDQEHGPNMSENGNYILDCRVPPIADPRALEADLRSIPGVLDTGLFLGLADLVLIGDRHTFATREVRERQGSTRSHLA
ncbi:MAG: ribose-5-phosphate isomerase RpiA [Pirellulaceae bacterium]